ncbi:Na+/H+ antiporter NhaC family protein [Pygmaiobacter massiliensis]|uniref:Na+/H+ antiporter NhaC family protein n=1 Tax=Pygmaiobacter massiliensis TaxID=1917873 RepID=UPI000C7DD635|nr:Na+/H+ antiporter NhaC family protein [Pygmaiobacter massiliensis]
MSNKKDSVSIQAEKNYGFAAFAPLFIFIAIYVGCGFFFTAIGTPDPFKQVPRNFALIVAIIVALLMGKRKFSVKFDSCCEKMASPGLMTMFMVLIFAGIFAGTTKAMGAVSSTTNLGLSLLPPSFLVPSLFLISAVLATVMGTHMGTIAAIGPVAVGLAQATGLDTGLAMAAVVGGGMFGDNLSIISDTTIVATRSAGCQMKDKFRMNFAIAVPAAIVTMIVYGVMTSGAVVAAGDYAYELIKIVPYVAVLVLAVAGMDVIIVLIAGTLLSGVIGMVTGTLTIVTFSQAVASGAASMLDTIFIALMLKAIVGLVEDMGGLHSLAVMAHKNIKSRRGAQYFMGLLVGIIDFFVGNNTVCILLSAPLCKPIAKKFRVAPERFASILDIFACIIPGLSPIGTGMLMATSLAGLDSPFEIIKYSFYVVFLLIAVCATIQFNLLRTKEEIAGNEFYPELEEVA